MTKNTTIFKEFKCNSTIVVHPKMDRPIDKKKTERKCITYQPFFVHIKHKLLVTSVLVVNTTYYMGINT